ncbi:MAG: nuclear transport factor 2 family protein [Acidobacteria bacterium]|nr:nuclear transport factor 2 family protein [Acidobacteriota bacterium]
MKNFALIGFIIVALTGSVFSQKKTTAKVDHSKEVRAVFDILIEGIKSADVEKVMSVYEKSDRTLFFNNNGSATIGWETMRANRERLYSKTTNVTLETTGVRVEILSPTTAYVSCKWKQTQDFDGKAESASGRMTLVFKKIGKDWKVVHLHTSPDMPDANRPVMPSERTTPTPDSVSYINISFGAESQLSLAKYKRLKTGMSYRAVVSILGSEGEVTFSETVGNYQIRSYKWDGGNYRMIFATFTNDKMTSKTQANLD